MHVPTLRSGMDNLRYAQLAHPTGTVFMQHIAKKRMLKKA